MTRRINQHKFESAIYRHFLYGDETRISETTGKSPSYYSQMFNPEDPRESTLFRAANEIVALIGVDRARGFEILREFNEAIEKAVVGNGTERDHAIVLITKAESELAGARAVLEGAANIRSFAAAAVGQKKKGK